VGWRCRCGAIYLIAQFIYRSSLGPASVFEIWGEINRREGPAEGLDRLRNVVGSRMLLSSRPLPLKSTPAQVVKLVDTHA
jgi:hypothetical protein